MRPLMPVSIDAPEAGAVSGLVARAPSLPAVALASPWSPQCLGGPEVAPADHRSGGSQAVVAAAVVLVVARRLDGLEAAVVARVARHHGDPHAPPSVCARSSRGTAKTGAVPDTVPNKVPGKAGTVAARAPGSWHGSRIRQ